MLPHWRERTRTGRLRAPGPITRGCKRHGGQVRTCATGFIGASSLVLASSLLVFPAQAAEPAVPEPRVASQSCTGSGPTTGVASAAGRVTNDGNGVSAARVYAYDLETGSITCVLSASDGTYTVPLPGVTSGSSLRRPVSGWVVAAAAPSGSALGGTSRTLAWNSVSPSGTVTVTDLLLGAATVKAKATVDDQVVTAPTLVCAGFESVEWAGPCGIAPAGSTDPVALSTGSGAPQSIVAQAKVDGSWWRAWESSGASGVTVTVPLDAEASRASRQCALGQPVRGSVTREVDGAIVGVQSSVEAFGLWTVGGSPYRAYLGDALSDRDGSYTLCADFTQLPGGSTAGVRLVVNATSVLGGVTTVTAMANSCTAGCVGEDVRLDSTPDLGGSVTYGGLTGLAAQVPFAWWHVYSGSLDQGEPVYDFHVSGGYAGPDGVWGLAFADGLNPVPNGEYLAQIRPPAGRMGYPETFTQFTSSNSSAAVNVALETGNFVGRALAADGSALEWSWLSARQVECTSRCVYRGASTDSQGWFAMEIPDGIYDVTAYAPWGSTTTVNTTRRVVVSGGVVTTIDGSPPANPLEFVMEGPNARILVRAAGSAVPETHLSVMRWSDLGSLDWFADGYTSTTGVAGLKLTPGEYVVAVNHWGSQLVPPTVQHWKVTQSGSDISISSCAITGRLYERPCPSGSSVTAFPRDSSGDWLLDLPAANLVATVTSPDGQQSVAEASVCLVQEGSNSWSNWQDYLGCRGTNSAGKVAFHLPPSSDFSLHIQPPWNSEADWVASTFRFRTDQAGNVCSVASSSSCTPLASPNIALPFSGPNVIATVRGVGGTELNGGWAYVEKACFHYWECREWVTSTSVSSRGRISLKLDASDDTYYLRVFPGNLNDGSVETSFAFRVTDANAVQNLSLQLKAPNVTGTVRDSTGTVAPYAQINVERAVGDMWTWVNVHASTSLTGEYRLLLDPGTYRLRLQPQQEDRSRAVATVSSTFTVGNSPVSLDVSLRAPNFTGVIKRSGGVALPYAWIQVQKWYDAYGYYVWSDEVAGSDSGANGAFGLNLPAGRWRLVINPPWGVLTASRTIVPVRSNGVGVCLDVSPYTTCTSDRYLLPGYVVTMDSPNVSGQVRMPDGVGEVSYAWIEVQRWIDDTTGFSWDFDLPEATTGPAATFALKLPTGRWRLTAHPDTALAGATRNSVDVTVDSSGLCLTSSAPCSSANLIPLGSLNVALRSPNVLGTVTAGGASVPYAWAYADRWNSTWGGWESTNNYAWTREGGRYVFTLLDDGDYRIRANASGGLRGYTEGATYLRVASEEVCELTGSPESGGSPSCRGAGALDDSILVTTSLTPVNVVAVITGEGRPAPWTWVQLQQQVNGEWEGRQGNHTLGDGSVSLSVSTDDSAVFRLRIEPPWGSNVDYVRTYAPFVAYRDGATTRICAPSNWTPASRTCTVPVTNAVPLQVALNVGGLRGRVTTPDGNSGIPWSWIEVQQWRAYSGSPSQHAWMWTDAYAHASYTGNFTLSVEDPGIYRLTAYPTWPNLSGWSKRTVIVQFDGAGGWCRQNAISGTGPASEFGPCDDTPGMSATRLPMPLLASNVIGGIVFDDTVNGVRTSRAMPYGWIAVEKQATGEWVTSLSTSDQGRFAMFLEDDTYVVTGYPNWRFTQRPPVSKTIVVRDGVVISGLTNGELKLDLDAVPPNVLLTVNGVTGQRLIAVERDANDDTTSVDWEFESAYSTSTNGETPNVAALNLRPGIYRLTVVPDIGKVISPSTPVEITVLPSGVVQAAVSITETNAPTPSASP